MKGEKIINRVKAKSDKRSARSVAKYLILYLDTSEEKATLALYRLKKGRTFLGSQGPSLVEQVRWLAGRELSKTLSAKYLELLGKVHEQLEQDSHSESMEQPEHSLAGVCVFVGPGSFTGLRIGISFANALAFGLGIPVYETKERGKINLSKEKVLATPFYGSPPRITKPRK